MTGPHPVAAETRRQHREHTFPSLDYQVVRRLALPPAGPI
jgi:hypothetical protein